MTKDDYQMQFEECQLIAGCVASAFGVSMTDMKSSRRSSYGVNMGDARSMYYYLARNHTTASYPIIGDALSKDHTSVISGCKRAHDKFNDYSWHSRLLLVTDFLGFNRL